MKTARSLSLCLISGGILLHHGVCQNDNVASPPDGSSCWDNTTAIYESLFDAPPYSSNTYILCPNTVYNIGYLDSQGVCCEDGQMPLMARTNTKFQCGEDGSSANNCTLSGGTNQFYITPLAFSENEATGVVIQGITFSQAGMAATVPNQIGDFTFLDCIFENSQNSGTVVVLFNPGSTGSNTNRRMKRAMADLEYASIEQRIGYIMSEDYLSDALADSEEHHEQSLQVKDLKERDLQQDVCQLFFNQTVFRNNSQGPTQGATTFGVVTVRSTGAFLSFNNCLFAENSFGNREVSQQGYAIESWGSDVEIRNTCFIQNNFIGFGVVHMWDGGLFKTKGVYGDVDDELTCEFLAYSDIQPEDVAEVTCTNYDSNTCLANIDPDLVPEPVPTVSPAPTPSGATSAPTSSAASRRASTRTLTAIAIVLIINYEYI